MKEIFEVAVVAFESMAIFVLILGAVISAGKFLTCVWHKEERNGAYRRFRQSFGRTLLLVLDLLVAADIILTVTLDLSFRTLGMLGILVLIRTFLHFVLELEVTGRWPWQSAERNMGCSEDRQSR